MALIGAFAPPERVAELARAIDALATSDREAARGVVQDLEQVSEDLAADRALTRAIALRSTDIEPRRKAKP